MVSGIRSLTSKCFSYNTLLSKTALSKSKSSYHLTAIRRQPYACPALLIAVLCTRCCMYALLSMGGWKLDLVLFPEQSWNIIPEKCPQRQQRTVETKSGTGDNGYTWGYRFFSSPIGLWPILQTCSTAESMFLQCPIDMVIISFRAALLSDLLLSYSCHTVQNTPTVYHPSSNVPTPRDNLPEVHFLISFPLVPLVCWKVTTHICTQKTEVSRTLIRKIPAAYWWHPRTYLIQQLWWVRIVISDLHLNYPTLGHKSQR